MDNKKIVGIIIFIILIVIIAGIYFIGGASRIDGQTKPGETIVVKNKDLSSVDHVNTIDNINVPGLTTVYVAAGGGKEGFVADSDIHKILMEKYNLNVIYDNWSNGKLVLWPVVREQVDRGNKLLRKASDLTIRTEGATPYDAIFPSDQRYYDYYQLTADSSKGEAERFRTQGGSLTLNTPIVVYSWANVTDALIKENIVTEKEGTYYITDMPKLMKYMLEKKKWSEIGLDDYFGAIEIKSVDPVKSSPGATYYGLLLSIYCEGIVTDESVIANLPSLKDFYNKAGALPHSPADLFDSYIKQTLPLVVDYEKSIVNLATDHPSEFESIKDDMRILYPEPTMWNSHCYEYFTDAGKQLFDALSDPEIQKIAWEKYGFRTGVRGGSYDTAQFGVGIPQNIIKTVSGLKMENYDKLIKYLEEKDETKAYNILHDIEE